MNDKIKFIESIFIEKYKDAKTELIYNNLYELLICVILSAQCTDKRVNIVTPALFKKYPNIQSLSQASLNNVKEIIHSCSFYNNKAKNIINLAKQVITKYNGIIPLDRDILKSLPGVGQKTANVVLLEYCEANLMAVDTHVFRVSHRLGLSKAKNVIDTEKDLNNIFKKNRNILHQGFVLFGRYICKSLKPQCDICFVKQYCEHIVGNIMEILKLALVSAIKESLNIDLNETSIALKQSFSSKINLGENTFIVIINKALINKFALDFLNDENPNLDSIQEITKEISNLIIGKAKVLFEENNNILKLGTPIFIGKDKIKKYNYSIHFKFKTFRCSIYKVK